MAEKLTLDDGVLELEINENGVLRFNPSDPNVYQRFLTLARELPELESKYTLELERTEAPGNEMVRTEGALEKMRTFDADVKGRLGEVFGRENDFDALLGGVNLLAVGRNGERVVTNLLRALTPYIERGIDSYRRDQAAAAIEAANKNRAQRRAE